MLPIRVCGQNTKWETQIITSYVDDCTVAVMDDKARDELMSEMRERFEIKEGEGQPINYLLGILIKQDLEAEPSLDAGTRSYQASGCVFDGRRKGES